MRDAADFLDRFVQRNGAFADCLDSADIIRRDLAPREIDRKTHADKILGNAIMQFPGNAQTLLLLGIDDPLHQFLEPAIRQPLLAQIEQHAGGKHQQYGGNRKQGDDQEVPGDRMPQLLLRRCRRRKNVVEVNAGTDHPAPFVEAGRK